MFHMKNFIWIQNKTKKSKEKKNIKLDLVKHNGQKKAIVGGK